MGQILLTPEETAQIIFKCKGTVKDARHEVNKAQLKKVVEYLNTLTFYDDWGGESGKKTVEMIQQTILKELGGELLPNEL